MRRNSKLRSGSGRAAGVQQATLALFLLCAPACGGVVEGDPTRDEPEHQARGEGSEMPLAPETGSEGAEFRLEECRGGTSPHGEICPWIDEEAALCFASKEDACSCLCPLDRESICRSGLYNGESGRVVVRCD